MYSNLGVGSLFDESLFVKLFKIVDVDGDEALEKAEVIDLILMAVTGKTDIESSEIAADKTVLKAGAENDDTVNK